MRSSTRARNTVVCALGLSLAACGGGGGGSAPDAICQVVGHGSYVSAAPGPGSTFDNSTAAFDGDLATSATLNPATSASGTISGGGLSEHGGGAAGFAFPRPHSGALTFTVQTLLNGVPQDTSGQCTINYTPTGQDDSCAGPVVGDNIDNQRFYGVSTTKDFDTIQVTLSTSNFSAPLELEELCVK